MLITFEPKSDDTFVKPSILIEVATVKPSGYMQGRVIVPEAMLPQAMQAVRNYYSEKGRPEPVIYTRQAGSLSWTAEVSESEIPDSLPDDFS